MNSKLFMTLLFLSALVLGCSSGGSSSTKPDEPEPDVGVPANPIEGETENPIEKDQGYKFIDGVVYLDGEVLGTIEDHTDTIQKVVDAEGNTLAFIEQTGQGYRIIINHEGSGESRDVFHIKQDGQGKWTIDWANSVIDHGWGLDPDSVPKPEPVAMTDAQKKAAFKKRLQSVRDNIKTKKLKR